MNDKSITLLITVDFCIFINNYLSIFNFRCPLWLPLEMCLKHRNVRREILRLWLSQESDNGVRSKIIGILVGTALAVTFQTREHFTISAFLFGKIQRRSGVVRWACRKTRKGAASCLSASAHGELGNIQTNLTPMASSGRKPGGAMLEDGERFFC